MTNFITTHEQWLDAYRQDKYKIWIRATLSDGQEIYFSDYDTWYDIKSLCDSSDVTVDGIKLQYRSNLVETSTSNSDGVYLVRSLKGQIGGETSHYYTVGIIEGDTVHKTMWLTPELIEEEKSEDPLDNCFEEAIIYHHAQKSNSQEQV